MTGLNVGGRGVETHKYEDGVWVGGAPGIYRQKHAKTLVISEQHHVISLS